MKLRFWENKDIQKTKDKLAYKEELRKVKVEYRLNAKQNKYAEKKKKNIIKEKNKWFNFFTKCFFYRNNFSFIKCMSIYLH